MNDPGTTKKDDGSPKLLREFSEKDLHDLMDKISVHLKAFTPIDADFAFFMINPYNGTTAWATTLDKFNAGEFLRKAATLLEKGNKDGNSN